MTPTARRRATWTGKAETVESILADEVNIRLDGVPIGKGRPRFGNGRTYTPEKTRAYEEALAWEAVRAMRGRDVLTDALVVDVEARMPVPVSWSKAKRADALAGRLHPTSTPDLDNILKCLDALNGVVFLDDKQIVSALVWKRFHETPSLSICIRTITAADQAAA